VILPKDRAARAIAFYLPQYHPIPENDMWWGKGFTEWTNAAKAKPLFKGHYQPHLPADLGYYDLRVPETRAAQANMAREYGLEAFCYYHYWFAGRRLLERPFNEVLESGKPDFPFCLCWANQTWTGIWHGDEKRILIEQTYPGEEDQRAHFSYLARAFADRRYLTVDGKPLFLIFRPTEIPGVKNLTDSWREMAEKAGFEGLYLVGFSWDPAWIPQSHGFDASVIQNLPKPGEWFSKRRPIEWLIKHYYALRGKPAIYSYKQIAPTLLAKELVNIRNYPCVVPNWDNTPRSGRRGLVLHESTPELFRIHLKEALDMVRQLPSDNRLLFVKSWNEWAEGNHLEPDLRFGNAYLKVIKEEIMKGD